LTVKEVGPHVETSNEEAATEARGPSGPRTVESGGREQSYSTSKSGQWTYDRAITDFVD
jgi:hypothetical protein